MPLNPGVVIAQEFAINIANLYAHGCCEEMRVMYSDGSMMRVRGTAYRVGSPVTFDVDVEITVTARNLEAVLEREIPSQSTGEGS